MKKKNTLKMTDEQHEIAKSDSVIFHFKKKIEDTKRDHLTSDRMFPSFVSLRID
jgi:hypothetical protein